MHRAPRTPRRQFLRTLGASTLAAPFLARGWAATPPSNRILHATFGAGGMAWADLNALAQHPDFQLVAVAEVDLNRTAELRKKFPAARIYQDWRQLLEREKTLTSVNVSTPDHMHAPMAMSALHHDLHVYCQKPLTHDLYECRQLTQVARRKKRVTQMGIQIQSNPEYRMAVRLVQDGTIGKIQEVHSWSDKKWGETGPRPDRSDPIPEGFDWDFWIGVCQPRPYLQGWYHPGEWRRRLDFGTGTFGDMGCHILDPVFGALQLTAPASVRSEGAAPNAHSWAVNALIRYRFPATRHTVEGLIPVTWYDGDRRPPGDIQALVGASDPSRLPGQGSIFVGTQGALLLPHIGWPALFPESQFKGFNLPDVGRADHWLQFLDAIQGKGRTTAGFDYAGPLTESVLLGSVATRFPDTTLDWDAARLRFPNRKEADQFVRKTYRKGWTVKDL